MYRNKKEFKVETKSIFSNINKSFKKLGKGDVLGSAWALGTAVYGISSNIMENNKMLAEENKKKQEEQIIYERTFNKIQGMLPITNNKIFFQNMKTSFDRDNNMTQYIKFYLFNDMTMEITDVTEELYLLSGNLLILNLRHGDLQKTVKCTNTDFMYMQETLRKVLGNVIFKCL